MVLLRSVAIHSLTNGSANGESFHRSGLSVWWLRISEKCYDVNGIMKQSWKMSNLLFNPLTWQISRWRHLSHFNLQRSFWVEESFALFMLVYTLTEWFGKDSNMVANLISRLARIEVLVSLWYVEIADTFWLWPFELAVSLVTLWSLDGMDNANTVWLWPLEVAVSLQIDLGREVSIWINSHPQNSSNFKFFFRSFSNFKSTFCDFGLLFPNVSKNSDCPSKWFRQIRITADQAMNNTRVLALILAIVEKNMSMCHLWSIYIMALFKMTIQKSCTFYQLKNQKCLNMRCCISSLNIDQCTAEWQLILQ